MDIPHVFQQCSPLASLQATADIDAEIREELEFHLHMRTRDNLSAGMSPEQASHDAQQRFGDFEANRRACRKITLGPRLLLHRLQMGLLFVLLGTVIYQSVQLLQLKNSSRREIESLNQLVEQLRADREINFETTSDGSANIPYTQWNFQSLGSITAKVDQAEMKEFISWERADDPLRQPWSDWRALDKQTDYD